MVLSVLCLCVLRAGIVVPTTQTPQQPFGEVPYTKEVLGEAAWDVFMNPERVTMQAVSPIVVSDKNVLSLAIDVKYPKVTRYGPERELGEKVLKKLVDALTRWNRVPYNFCVFSPDHVITFSKGKDRLQLVTCFICGQMRTQLNDVRVASGSMPVGVQEVVYQTFTREEHSKAAAAARISREAFEVVDSAKSADLYLAANFVQNSYILGDIEMKRVRRLDAKGCRAFADLIMEAAYTEWRKLGHKEEPYEQEDNYMIRFDTKPRMEILLDQSGHCFVKRDGQVYPWRNGLLPVGAKLARLLKG